MYHLNFISFVCFLAWHLEAKMAVFNAGAKVIKPQGESADPFELTVSQVRSYEWSFRP